MDRGDIRKDKLQKLANQKFTHLFCTVEQFVRDDVQKAVKKLHSDGVNGIVVVDECHVVTEWATIKQDYGDVGNLRDRNFPKWAFVLMSATVTTKDKSEIVRKLKTLHGDKNSDAVEIWGICNRPNIYYIATQINSRQIKNPSKLENDSVTFDWVDNKPHDRDMKRVEEERKWFWDGEDIAIPGYGGSTWYASSRPIRTKEEKKYGRIPRLLQQVIRDLQRAANQGDLANFPRVVIFGRTKKDCDDIYEYLTETVLMWGRGVKGATWNRIIQKFTGETISKNAITRQMLEKDSPLRVVVCTKAFGMGIDIPNIYLSIHWGCPSTLSQFSQESGRVARDSSNSYSILYWTALDFKRAPAMLKAYITPAAGECRRLALMRPFNKGVEKMTSAQTKGTQEDAAIFALALQTWNAKTARAVMPAVDSTTAVMTALPTAMPAVAMTTTVIVITIATTSTIRMPWTTLPYTDWRRSHLTMTTTAVTDPVVNEVIIFSLTRTGLIPTLMNG